MSFSAIIHTLHELNDNSKQSRMYFIRENLRAQVKTEQTHGQINTDSGYQQQVSAVLLLLFQVGFSTPLFKKKKKLYMYTEKNIWNTKHKEIIPLFKKYVNVQLYILFQTIFCYIKIYFSFHKIGTIMNMQLCVFYHLTQEHFSMYLLF